MLNKIIVLLLFPGMIFFITSCVSDEQQHEINAQKCKSYGYKEHTKSFADCMKDVDFHNDDVDDREEDRERAANYGFLRNY